MTFEGDANYWRDKYLETLEAARRFQSELAEANTTIKQLHKDIRFVDDEFASTKAAHVKAVDELVACRAKLEATERLLRHADGTLAHLEHGINEHRRVEQNIKTDVLITRVRKEVA